MPGRMPSIAWEGRAFTSKVFWSYWPLALVDFHTANEPLSFIDVIFILASMSRAGILTVIS